MTTPPPQTDFRFKGQLGGVYKINLRIGEGGFSKIYSGIEIKRASCGGIPLGLIRPKEVIIKVCKNSINPDIKKKFFHAEIKALRALKNLPEDVVTLRDYTITENHCILVLNYLKHYIPLDELIQQITDSREDIEEDYPLNSTRTCEELNEVAPFTYREVLTLFLRLLRKVNNIEKAGIFHGDLNYTNFMISPHDYSIIIIDFGISAIFNRLEDFHETKLCGQFGDAFSYFFQPPEWISNRSSTPAHWTSWQMGCLLWFLRYNKYPFQTKHEILKAMDMFIQTEAPSKTAEVDNEEVVFQYIINRLLCPTMCRTSIFDVLQYLTKYVENKQWLGDEELKWLKEVHE